MPFQIRPFSSFRSATVSWEQKGDGILVRVGAARDLMAKHWFWIQVAETNKTQFGR